MFNIYAFNLGRARERKRTLSVVDSRVGGRQHANKEGEATPARERRVICAQRVSSGMPPDSCFSRQTDEGDEDADGGKCSTYGIDHGQDLVPVRNNEEGD